MGSLIVPTSGCVYIDTSVLIYSIEKHPMYGALVQPLWLEMSSGSIEVVSSELIIMESLVMPLRVRDTTLAAAFETAFTRPGMRLLPISSPVLRQAARLRANIPALRTPDAIHAATALAAQCAMFLANDPGFRRIPSLPVTVLDDVAP